MTDHARQHEALHVLGRPPLLGRALVSEENERFFGRLTVPHGHN